MTPHVLVVEDDRDLRDFLESVLRENNYFVKSVGSASEAFTQVDKFKPDLVLLDLGLPDMDGMSVCRKIKSEKPDTKVIIVTADDNVGQKVRGFSGGADDYLTKPFEPEELIARIKIRLKTDSEEKPLTIKDLTLNPKTIEVKRDGKMVNLTPQEFKLLQFLMMNSGEVLSRDTILNRVWFYSEEVDTRVVDVYVGYLRKKIDRGFKDKLIKSVRGFGYMLK
jgi:DNA-binding response OmpR family regulator